MVDFSRYRRTAQDELEHEKPEDSANQREHREHFLGRIFCAWRCRELLVRGKTGVEALGFFCTRQAIATLRAKNRIVCILRTTFWAKDNDLPFHRWIKRPC